MEIYSRFCRKEKRRRMGRLEDGRTTIHNANEKKPTKNKKLFCDFEFAS
jgi:hypothetical protein